MAKLNKPKIVICPVKPKPPGHPGGPKVAPSVEGGAVLTVFENALDLGQHDPFAPGLVVGSQSADSAETQSSNAMQFTAGSSRITKLQFTNPGDIHVDGAEAGSQFTWTSHLNGHLLAGHLGGPNGPIAIVIRMSGPFHIGPGGHLAPTIKTTLTDAFPHDDIQGNNDVQITGVHVTATDQNNKHATADVTVHVVDDVPTAVADTDSIPSGGHGPVTGNVITDAEANGDNGADTPGADGVTVVGVVKGDTNNNDDDTTTVGVAIQGQYGKLTLNTNGSYSYVRDTNTPGGHDDVFTYTIKDGDGDLAHTTLTIAIADAPPEITDLTPEAQGGDTSVDEDDLLALRGIGESAGSDTSKESTTQGGDFKINSPDGVKSLKIGGVEVIANDVFTPTDIATPFGNILHIISYVPATGVINYSYELVDNESHPSANGQNSIFENFTVDVVDQDDDPASATLAVKIVDDVPTAANDGIFQVNQGTAFEIDALANDIFGADGVDTDNDPAVVVSVTTGPSQGTATYDATTGKFTYTSNGAASGSDSFTYTIVDRDGDSSTATVTVDVKGDDSHAQAGQTSALVDEDDLPVIGNHDVAPGDDVPTAQPGLLPHNYGSDGAGTTKFVAGDETVNGVHYTYSVNGAGTVLTAHDDVNNVDVFTATLSDNSSGSYTVQLLAPIDHPDPNTEDNLDFHLSYAVLDSDDVAPVNGSLTLTIDDDSPNASRADVAADTLVLDETRPEGTETDGDSSPAGLASVTANFADNFNAPAYGADGPGTTTYSLVLTGSNVNSGLFALDPSDTVLDADGIGQGAQIVLNQSGNTITGTVGATPYFTISIDPTTGVVSFAQSNNIWHGNTGSDDDTSTLTLANANLLQVVQTVKDADGDTDTAAVNVGTGVFQIEDDGPDAVVANGVHAPIVLDETRPEGTETDGDSSPAGLASVTAAFAPNFAAVTDYGSDGAGSTTYSLVLTGSNVNSGLFALDPSDTVLDADGIGQGAQIVLNQSGNTITGTVGATPYFTISIDPTTGVVSFAQSNNIWHGNTGSDDDTSTLTLANANLLQVVQTVKDADGDTDTAAVNVGTGVFQIEDDGPDAVVANGVHAPIVLDETRPEGTETDGDSSPAGLASVTAAFAPNFAAVTDYGSDGPGTTTYSLVLTGSNVNSGLFALDPSDTVLDADGIGQGAQIVLNQSGNTITGTVGATPYFTISIDPTTGVVSFAQSNNIWHGNTGSDDDTSTLTLANANLLQVVQTVKDADGDTDTAAVNVGTGVFQIEDDGPDAVVANGVHAPIVLDETRPVGTETDGDSSPAGLASVTAAFAPNFAAVTDYGSDGAGSTTYSLALTGSNVNSGLFALDPSDTVLDADGIGQGAQIVLNQSGNTITGTVGATPYFTISIDPTTGVVSFAQSNNIWHGNTGSDDDTSTLTLANANLLQVVQTVKDADGDTDTAAVNVGTGVFQIEDDGPSAANVTKIINEGVRDTNLSLILDVSGSMDDPSGLTGLTRLDVLKASVIELFEQYDNVGDVRVQLVTFATNATQVGSDWMTLATAKSFIQNLTATTTTNYDAALNQLQAIYGDPGKLSTPGVQSVAYFVSDGQPNAPAGSEGISAAEEATWTNFLNANNINAFALGAGSGVTQSALDPVAYNGQTHVNTNSIVVTDLSQLAVTLTGTVNAVTGNLLTEGPAKFGTDGGYVKAVTANGSTYTYNPATDAITVAGTDHGSFNSATNVLTIALVNGASFTIDIDDGSYSYTAPPVVNANISEPIGFTLTDTDGDTQSATLTVNVNNADLGPIVRDDHVITNVGTVAGDDPIVIPHYALLYNDIDPDGDAISVTAAVATSDLNSAAFNTPAGSVTAGDNDTDGGQFTYTGTANGKTDDGLVTISRPSTSAGTLTGTGLGEILLGGSGNDTLVGNEGRDVLIGGAGNDTFDFNATIHSPSLANADLIGDFEGDGAAVGDLINLADIDANTGAANDQAFIFNANATPGVNPGVVANHITWFQSGGNTIVQADVNGDTTADLVIVLRGLHALTGADFVL